MNVPEVKVCGIKTAAQAQMALSCGASFVGVNLWEQTPRYVVPEAVASVLEAVPQGKRVMVDVMPDLEKLKQAQAQGFDFFQIHFPFDTEESVVAGWTELLGKERLWLAPKLPPEQLCPEFLFAYAETFVVDGYRKDAFGGTGKVADWSRFRVLKESRPDVRWLLAGGLNPKNIVQAVQESSASFVDINSGVESAPGVKDEALVLAVFDALKTL